MSPIIWKMTIVTILYFWMGWNFIDESQKGMGLAYIFYGFANVGLFMASRGF